MLPTFSTKLRASLEGSKHTRRRQRLKLKLPVFANTAVRKMEEKVIEEQDCEALLKLSQASGT